MFRKSRRSIRFTIVSLLTALVVTTSVVVYLISYLGSANSSRWLAENLMKNIAGHLVDNTHNYLSAASQGSALTQKLASSGLQITRDSTRLIRYFRDILQTNPQFIMLNYGDLFGNFLMVKKMPDGTLSVKRVQRFDGYAYTTWVHENTDYSEEYSNAREPLNQAYDPRTRPWFQGVQKSHRRIWTNVYVFFSDKMPGISCATGIYDGKKLTGVVSIDIGLKELSQFISSLEIAKRGKAFLLNENNEVIAMPIHDENEFSLVQEKVQNQRTSYSLKHVRNIYDAEIVRSFEEYERNAFESEKDKEVYFDFKHNGRNYTSLYLPFPKEYDWNWKIGVIIPEDDFLSLVKRNNLITLLVSLLIVAISISLGVVFSKKISEPLARLSEQMDLIKDFNLHSRVDVSSSLIEVSRMVMSFKRMKSGLLSFEKYVPSLLVKQLMDMGKEAKPGGENREMTIFFSDIASFTTLAEQNSPEKLVEILAEYFEEMSNVIHENGGTVDKFIGDAIMAFWGAPLENKDHAYLAVKAAWECSLVLENLRKKWRQEGKPQIYARIGLNSGEVIVGNLGSKKRLNYTVVGDAVNLASRLEGLNKIYRTGIIVGEKTASQLQGKVSLRFLDQVTVKGKKEPVSVYEVLDVP